MMGVITDDNGLYHMRARYFNPQIKRFMNQDVLIGNICNSASLNRYSYVEGNPISYTDPFGLSPYMQALHAGLDLLGAIPGLEFCDGINAALYFLEGNWTEGLKSLVYMTPGMDLIGKAEKYAVNGGKYAKQALIAAEYATIAGRTMAALMASEDFGKTVAGMIDKYLVNEEELSIYIAVEFLQLLATGTQTVLYTGSMFKIPDELAKYDFDEILKQNIRARYETTPVDGYISGVTVNYSSVSGNDWTKVTNYCIRSTSGSYYSYDELKQLIRDSGLSGRGVGLEAHHLLEKQYASKFGVNEGDIISVALTPKWHRGVNGEKIIGEGINLNYEIENELMKITGMNNRILSNRNATAEQVWQAHRNVYDKIGRDDWANAIYEAYVKPMGIKY